MRDKHVTRQPAFVLSVIKNVVCNFACDFTLYFAKYSFYCGKMETAPPPFKQKIDALNVVKLDQFQ